MVFSDEVQRLALLSFTKRKEHMAYVIAEPCIGVKDAACVSVCPVNAIHPGPDERDFSSVPQLYIDPIECICCGICVQECPVNAIFDEQDLPEQWIGFIEKNASHFRDRQEEKRG